MNLGRKGGEFESGERQTVPADLCDRAFHTSETMTPKAWYCVDVKWVSLVQGKMMLKLGQIIELDHKAIREEHILRVLEP